jgi:hypothetical protein
VAQIATLRAIVGPAPASVEDALARLAGAKREDVARSLDALVWIGEPHTLDDGRYAAVPSR